MAYLLAAAALRPVERMRRQAEQMTGSESGERLAVPDTRDEIARLGGTLNELLAKVEASVDRERRFVANASHELRTPLALLRTELDLATRRPRSHVELEATVHSVSAEVDRLVTLANDLLVLARESDAGLPVTRNEVSVPALFAHCTSRFLSDERRIRLVVEPGPVGSVYADEERLRQALDNLVENAFVHGGGTVKLTAVDRADLVEIHVTDQGPGFEPALLARAFDRFTHRQRSSGNGLGLAIVAQIAQAHGGCAGASNSQGGGADVWLTLPKDRVRAPS
jgi:signal transduction histidine kinase